MVRIAVIGAGISGLTAARDLVRAGHDVLLVEGSDEVGGKIRAGEVAGRTVDVGAEAMLHRRPEGSELAAEMGLSVVHPTTATSRVWTRGALRPLPRTMMGAPLDIDSLSFSGVLSEAGLERARQRKMLVGPESDVSVGEAVEHSFGPEVVDRLVEPLLGGVYAGRAREISLRAAVPQLEALLTGRSDPPPPQPGAAPVFAGVAGGMWQLPISLAAEIMANAGSEVRTGATVRAIEATSTGYRLTFGPRPSPSYEMVTGVVLAVPAAPASRLLGELAPTAGAELREIDYASTALVTLAYRSADAQPLELGASGFLVPPIDGRQVKAATFSFAKWQWVRAAGDDLLVLRVSLGRHREERSLQAADDALIAAARTDLREATGLDAAPVDAVVRRWGGALPQYAVGHLDRVARIGAAVAQVPGVAVCGAAYEGVGIPACIASGHRAAVAVTRHG